MNVVWQFGGHGGLMVWSRSRLRDVLLLRLYPGEVPYYHVIMLLCHITTLLCYVRDHKTIAPQSCAYFQWVQSKAVIAPGRWHKAFSITPKCADLVRLEMTWDNEWFAEMCCFDCSAGLFRRCFFSFVGHMEFQEKACSDSYMQLMRVTARLVPKIRNILASPDLCRWFKILKRLLIPDVDYLVRSWPLIVKRCQSIRL